MEKQLIPQLRFPFFKDEWSIHKLIEISKVYDGTHQTPKYVSEGIPFYSVEHLTANQFERTKFISKEVFEKENKRVKLEKEDILMTRIGSIGVSKYIDWDVNASFYVSLALIKKSSNYDSRYLNQFIKSDFFQKELWKRTIHVAFPIKINLGEIGKCLTLLPSLPEQQKIASFLTDVDTKITQLTKKKELIEQYKKGIMQQLFNQELRFKDDDGNDFPEWEEVNHQINIVAGNAYEFDNYVDEGIVLIQGVNICPGKLEVSNPYFILNDETIKHIRLKKDDILLALNRPITNGKLKVCRYSLEEEGYLYQRAGKLVFNSNEIDPTFLYQFLMSRTFLKRLSVELVGSDQPYIKSKLFQKIKLTFPVIEEQIKIANFLSDIDTKIESVQSQIECSKTFKKGLLQQMFV